jgi:hypothetical protein
MPKLFSYVLTRILGGNDVTLFHTVVGCVVRAAPGVYVDCLDTRNEWLPAVIVTVDRDKVFIHYLDFSAKWDEWLTLPSSRIEPRSSRISSEQWDSSIRKAAPQTSN